VKDRSNVDLMAALLNDLRPAAEEAGVQVVPTDEFDMSGWTAERRRVGGATPSAECLERLRGTKNAIFKRT